MVLEMSRKVTKGSSTSPGMTGIINMIWYLTQVGLQKNVVIISSFDVSILKAIVHWLLFVLFISE